MTRQTYTTGALRPAISRREAFRTIGLGAALGLAGAGAVYAAVPVLAKEADPTLAAIDTHKAAYAAWMALEDENDPRSAELDAAEQEAWERVTQIVPTTFYGLARLSSYVSGHMAKEHIDRQSMQAALQTIAWSAATLQNGERA